MPLDLQNLTTDTATARVDYGANGDINLVYRPGNVTENSLAKLQYLQEMDALRKADPEHKSDIKESLEYMGAVNTLLCQMLISWDLKRNAVVIPLTDDALRDVPLGIRMDVLRAIYGDAEINPTTGTPSQPTSPATLEPEVSTFSGKQGNRASRRNSSKSR
ncbi:MAG: hypothetical protein ACXWQR_20485 [Ktedonobacterales bacterium]